MLTIVSMLVLSASPAPVAKTAPFEGTLTYRLSATGGQGLMRAMISRAGVRTDVALDFNGQKSNTTLIVRAQELGVTWQWDEQKKAFVKAAPAREPMPTPVLEVLAEQKVAGLACKHVKLTTGGTVTEYWTAPEFLGDATRAKLVGTAQRLAPEVEEALKSAHAWGLVVKSVSTANRATTAVELEKIERMPIDAKAFDLSER